MPTIYIEAQWDRERAMVRLLATAENGDRYPVVHPAANQDEADKAAQQFIAMYKSIGSRVVT
jgi:hypothetical protein